MTAAGEARLFHEAYERLAPGFGYKTREASAVEWDDVPEPNKSLMVAVAAEVVPLIAARAVDEALSVERVSVAMRKAWGPYWLTGTDDDGQPYEYLDVDAYAAAIVAHLRGPRTEGEG